MTINSINCNSIDGVVEEWKDKVNKIGFQFHTPFVKGDPLMLPFGKRRDEVVNKLIALHDKYPKFVINNEKQLLSMKGNWGGIGTIPVQCPSWAILSMDHMGRVKQPCCIASAAGGSSAKPYAKTAVLVATLFLLLMGLKERKDMHIYARRSCCYMQCSYIG
jgi:Fe-coproporphyrin III synthase